MPDETQSGDKASSFVRSQAPIVALFIANAIACTWIACFLTTENYEVALYVAVGIVFAQAIVLALWAALGAAPAFVRLAGSLALLLLPCLAVVIFYRRDNHDGRIGVGIAALTVLHWLIAQLPLWAARFVFAIVVGRSTDARRDVERQFSIGQVLWVTAIVGLLLAAGRAAYTSGGLEHIFGDRKNAIIAVVLLTADMALSLLAIRAVLTERRLAVWLAASLAFTILCSLAMNFALKLLNAVNYPDEVLQLDWLIGAQFAWLVGCLSLLRLAGYRWRGR